MTTHWNWVLSGTALALVVLGHWALLGRPLAVSGRITALVDRLRLGRAPEVPTMTADELIAAMQTAAKDAFGADAVHAEAREAPQLGTPLPLVPQAWWVHALFFVSLALGGLLASVLAGGYQMTSTLHGDLFAVTFGGSDGVLALVLLLGGILVGFGTRMAGGCTSGHGLCGVSRFQSGSFLATAAFFGTGIAVSLALEALW